MESISIIIPNFNGRNLLQGNLPFIIKLMNKWKEVCEILIVDDKSTDDSRSFLKSNFPQVVVIEKDENSGFIDSVNLGVKSARGSLVLLLNTDIIPKLNIVPKILPYFQDKKVFAVGCLDNSLENGTIIKRGRGIGSFRGGFLIHQRGEIDKSDTLWVSGGSGMFRKEIWEKLGGFDSLFRPFYWEDIDLSYRALKSGYSLYFEKEACVKHHHQEGAISKYYSKREIKKISLRNQILFVWKNISDVKYLLKHLIYLPIWIVRSLIKVDSLFPEAFILALVRLPQAIKERIRQSKFWIKTDQELLQRWNKIHE